MGFQAPLTLGFQPGQDGLGPTDRSRREGLHPLLGRVADSLDVGVALLGGRVGGGHHVAGGADEGHAGHAVHHAGLREGRLRPGTWLASPSLHSLGCTSQELPGSARRFLYLGPAAHLFEHDLDTHSEPGSDKRTPPSWSSGLKLTSVNYAPEPTPRASPPPAFSLAFFFFFLTALLKSSSYFIEFHHFKMHDSEGFSVFTRLCNSHCLISELIDRSGKKLVGIDYHTLAYRPLVTMNPLSVSVDFCLFRSFTKKWDHTWPSVSGLFDSVTFSRFIHAVALCQRFTPFLKNCSKIHIKFTI